MKFVLLLVVLFHLGTAYSVSFHPSFAWNRTFFAGEEVRVAVETPHHLNFSSLHVSLKIIPAYNGRSATGTVQHCNTTTDAWQTFFMAGGYASEPHTAYATVVVPPFPFKVCISDHTNTPSYRDPSPYGHASAILVNTSRSFFVASSLMVEGDYAAVRIKTQWAGAVTSPRRHQHFHGADGDTVKLVPTGMPCTFEKTTLSDGLGSTAYGSYCGGNSLNASGYWSNPSCIGEGSVSSGVGAVGTSSYNPLVDTEKPHTWDSDSLTAFFVLPSAGEYDVCYSPLALRRQYFGTKAPMWLKLFDGSKDGCDDGSAECTPQTTRLTIASTSAADVKWSAFDESAGTWGAITFHGTSLSSAVASSWDCKGCANLEYFTTTGDVFRLIPTDSTGAAPPSISRLLDADFTVTASATFGSSSDSLTLRQRKANTGSSPTKIGCWDRSADNYGHLGATMNGAVDTALGDSGASGVTASGNLGAHPRSSELAHLADGTAQDVTAAYVRFPAGSYYVCFRKNGVHNWRVIEHTDSTHSKSLQNSVAAVHTSTVYQVNDTRAGTFAELTLQATSSTLHVTPSNYFTAEASVQSTGFKIVAATTSCDTAASVASSWNPGTPTCSPEQCGFKESCGLGECFGRFDDSTVPQQRASFIFQVPTAGSSYRVCVKIGTANWYEAIQLTPEAAPKVSYSLIDARMGARVGIVFELQNGANSDTHLDSSVATATAGDLVRLIPAVNGAGDEQFCDLTWKAGLTQTFSNMNTDYDLGMYCRDGSVDSRCDESLRNPVSGFTRGMYPNSQFALSASGVVSSSQATVAFFSLPKTNTPLKVCYKQQGLNWIEAVASDDSNSFTPSVGLGCSVKSDALRAGQFSFLNVTCDSNIDATKAAVKLTKLDEGCEYPARGSPTSGSIYSASTFSGNGSRIEQHSASSVNAFFTMPVDSSRSKMTYTVCFMDVFESNRSWTPIGSVVIEDTKLWSETTTSPLFQEALTVKITAPSAVLDTRPGKDAAKLVDFYDKCVDSSDDVLSAHVSWSSPVESMISNLGPSDTSHTALAEFDVTIPPQLQSNDQCFKICYRQASTPWVEVPLMSFSSICAIAARVSSVSLHPDLFAVDATLFTGTSTFWDFAINNHLSTDNTVLYNGDMSFMNVDNSASQSDDSFKFVLQKQGDENCLNPAFGTEVTPTSSHAIHTDLPVSSGNILACYKQGSRWTKLQLLNSSSKMLLSNPFKVADSMLNSITTSNMISIEDKRTGLLDGVLASFGTITATDVVYIIPATGVCGQTSGFLGADVLSSVAFLTSGSGSVSFLRNTNANSSRLPSSGTFKFCYFRTKDQRVNSSSSIIADVKRNMWYHVTYDGRPLFSTLQLKTISLSCPSPSVSSGVYIPFTATLKSSTNSLVTLLPGTTMKISGNGFDFVNTEGTCMPLESAEYGLGDSANVQLIDESTESLLLLPLTSCTSNCTVQVSVGDVSSNICSFEVSKVPVTSLNFITAPNECQLEKQCKFTVGMLDASGMPAYSTDSPVAVSFSSHAALILSHKFTKVAGGLLSIEADFTFNVTLANEWQNDYTITATVTVGNAETSTSFVVKRPTPSRMIISDIYPVDASGNYVQRLEVPHWEPSTSTNNFIFEQTSDLSSVGMDGYFLVAGQYYMVQLRLLDTYGRSVPSAFLAAAITTSFTGNASLNGLYGEPSSTADVHDTTAVKRFVTTKSDAKVMFRVKNSIGCRYTDGGCKISFRVEGTSVEATLSSVVRSTSVILNSNCVVNNGAPTANGCSATTVEDGFTLTVHALDQFGVIDEHFGGELGLVLHAPDEDNTDVIPFDKLGENTAIWGDVKMSRGVATIKATLTKPCQKDCFVTIISNNGADSITIPVDVRPSTKKLSCSLSTQLYQQKTTDGSVSRITNEDYKKALVYTDTELCFDIEAQNADGKRTFYESMWSFYHVNAAGSVPVSTRETQQSKPRVQRLSKSHARFCFVATATADTEFSVSFGVQKFNTDSSGNTHWSQTAGSCSVNSIRLLAEKIPARMVITSVSGQFTELPTSEYHSPSPNVWVWAQHPSPSSSVLSNSGSVDINVGFMDHYGSLIDIPSTSSLAQKHVLVDGCSKEQLEGVGCNSARVTADHPQEDSGIVSMQPTSSQIAASSAVRFSFKVQGFCLRCNTKLTLFKSDGSPVIDSTFGTVSAVLSVTYLLPSTAERFIVFPHEKSPYRVWDSFPTPKNNITTMFPTSCLDGSCDIPHERLLTPHCLGSGTVLNNNGSDIELLVVSTIASKAVGTNGLGESTCTTNTCSSTTIQNQVDIFSTFNVEVSIGSQVIQCVGSTCNNDNSNKVSKDLAGYGSTPVDAILQLTKPLRTARFQLRGILPSSPQKRSGDNVVGVPSMRGTFHVDATLNSSTTVGNLVSSSVLMWAGSRLPSGIRVLDIASTVDCVTTEMADSTTPDHNGYVEQIPVDDLQFAYSKEKGTEIIAGMYFPITIELHDEQGAKVVHNGGSVEFSKSVVSGCNSGGNFTVKGGSRHSIKNGRVTAWVSFSATCERCYVSVKLIPDGSSAYSKIEGLVATHHAVSRRISVVKGRSAFVVAVSSPMRLPSKVVIDQELTVSFKGMGRVGRIPYDVDGVSATVKLYNKIATQSNMVLVGNGGILKRGGAPLTRVRGSLVMTFTDNSAEPSMTFAFQRPCQSCNVAAQWRMGGSRGRFDLRTTSGTGFQVTAPSTTAAVLGYMPRIVPRGVPWVVTIADSADGAGFGVGAEPTLNVQLLPGNRINGDGGSLEVHTVRMGSTRVILLFASDPCGDCTLRINGVDTKVIVATEAKYLRVQSVTPRRVAPGGEVVAVKLFASDDAGFVDVTAGGPTDCSFYPLFVCDGTRPSISVTPSVNGVSPFGFQPAASHFHVGGSDAQFAIELSDNRLVNGEAVVKMNFTAPVRLLDPIFTVDTLQISSNPQRSISDRAIDVVVPNRDNVRLAVEQPKITHNSYTALSIKVGITKNYAGGGTQYVVASATNTIVAKFGEFCGNVPEQNLVAVRGIATLKRTFSMTPVGSPCRVTFELKSGNGVTCTSCTVVTDITIVTPAVSSWVFLRPEPIEQGGAGYPRYAAAGRRQFVEVAPVVKLGNSHVVVDTCDNCKIDVQFVNCGDNAPTLSTASPIQFKNGRAKFALRWPTATSSYSCSIKMKVSKGSANLPTTNGNEHWQTSTTVCVPHHVRILTNVTEFVDAQGNAPTGKAFPVTVAMMDKEGNICSGDTQEDATQISVSIPTVTTDSAVKVNVLNVNPYTNSITKDTTPNAVNNQVRLISGKYTFSLILTASARQANVDSVRLRFNAVSDAPRLEQVVYTSSFVPVVSAGRLRIRPDAVLPRYVTSFRSVRSTGVVVEAVDNVYSHWLQYAPNAPNVAAGTAEFGSTADFEWVVDPLSPGAMFPLQFSSGSRLMSLASGSATVHFNYIGADGTFNIYVRDRDGRLATSEPQLVTFQSIKRIGINKVDTEYCKLSACNITDPAFNTTELELSGRLTLKQESTFKINAALLDVAGKPVLGDHDSVLGVRMIKRASSTGTAALKNCVGSACSEGPFYATVSQGVASFEVVFVGTTHGADAQHEPIELEVFCPRLLSRENPCLNLNLATARTTPIVVLDNKVVTDVTAIIKEHVPKLRVPLTATALNDFNIATFKQTVLAQLVNNDNSKWPSTANNVNRIDVIACEVDVSEYGTKALGTNVCGAKTMCQTPYDFSCPSGVRLCSCAGTASSSTRRSLQQAAITVVAELTFDIRPSDVVGQDIPNLMQDIGSFIVREIQTNSTAFSSVDNAQVSLIISDNGPQPTTPPPSTPQPNTSTVAPPTPTPTLTSNSVGITVWASIAFALVLFLLV